MRTIPSALTSHFANNESYNMANLVELHLTPVSGNDAVIYLTDYFNDIDYDGETYYGVGSLVGISAIDSSSDLQVQDIKLTLEGVTQTYFSYILQYYYVDRKCCIHKVFLNNTTDAIIGNPIKVFEGRLNNPTIQDDPINGSSVVTLTVSNYLSDFDKRPTRFTNHTQHKSLYPDDNFFSKWGKIDKEIIWGMED
jgi:hypothetical protein